MVALLVQPAPCWRGIRRMPEHWGLNAALAIGKASPTTEMHDVHVRVEPVLATEAGQPVCTAPKDGPELAALLVLAEALVHHVFVGGRSMLLAVSHPTDRPRYSEGCPPTATKASLIEGQHCQRLVAPVYWSWR
mmetsp:Transcript_12992/g.25945  ORF Transcript_12992/g.25945 Transcript_12992/m.25945 type:complete len:134 (-) Transcript_12992:774-1175(-)